MARKFFGSDLDADYFEGYMPMQGNGHKSIVPLYGSGNLPAFPKKPFVTGGKIELADYMFGVPYKKRKLTWINVHSGDESAHLSELDLYAKLIKAMR